MQEHLRIAKFSQSKRHLLTDRHRIADGAVMYCLACSLWRGYVGTLGADSPLAHLNSLTAVSRLLEHSQATYEFVAFGHHDLWQSPRAAAARVAAPSKGVIPYAWIVLPEADALADADVALLTGYVRGGGLI